MVRTGWMGHYHPLSWLSLALDEARGGNPQAGGLDPAPFHATNVALHGLAALAVYALALRLLSWQEVRGWVGVVGAAFAALFFAVHPLRVESVAWVTERRDVLCAPFFVLAVWSWLGRRGAAPASALRARPLAAAVAFAAAAVVLFFASVDRGRPGVLEWGALGGTGLALAAAAWIASVACAARAATPGTRWSVVASASLLLVSLGAKAWGIVVPALLLLCDAWPLQRARGSAARARAWGALIAEKAPFAALAVMFGALASWAQASQAGTLRTLADHGLGERAAQASWGLWFYSWRTLVPVGLAPIYELPESLSLFERRYLLAALVVAALTALLILARRRIPAALAAWIAFVVIVSPVLGVLQSGPQLAADRYTYLSAIPLALLAGGGLAMLLERAPPARPIAALVALGWLAILAGASRAQSRFWIDSESLWTRAVAVQPQSPLAHLGLGYVQFERSYAEPDPRRRRAELEAAAARFQLGIELGELPRLYSNLALVEANLAELEPERAAERTARGVQLTHRALVLARERGVPEPELYLCHAVLLARAGRTEESLPFFEAFARERPGDPTAHVRLAGALQALRRDAEAREALERALALDPTNAQARKALREMGG